MTMKVRAEGSGMGQLLQHLTWIEPFTVDRLRQRSQGGCGDGADALQSFLGRERARHSRFQTDGGQGLVQWAWILRDALLCGG